MVTIKIRVCESPGNVIAVIFFFCFYNFKHAFSSFVTILQFGIDQTLSCDSAQTDK